MAVYRKKDLKSMPEAELKAKLADVEKEVDQERASTKATGKPKNAGRFKELRKVKARILTILKQREIKK
ncbi:MAG: 50S ribosomal protein L29 [Candidatus Micrarchaeota archaeon]